ncbi:hypothetical protein GQ55_4G046500 [Panicum hallii var. hallii]|uniref:Late embryogenesis abundant protein LEA-2 subgroup domain-containing protein n=1 Tax=Panicum hallii var. hallii TaxID=1504633 RepID=A0A2T7DV95_9POAL|nr:hypothetical protein GQ55_4G046500 [Panicum hallii var. hallii]
MTAIADDCVLRKPTDDSKDHRSWRRRVRRPCRIALDLMAGAATAATLIWVVQFFIDVRKVASFSVDLAALEGLNATAGRTVSPGFVLAVRVENPRVLVPWCCAGGQAVVSYGGVSLAWGPVPRFCALSKGAAELAVAAKGRGVGLSDDLRRTFAAEWNAGTARAVVEMKLFYLDNGWSNTPAYKGVSLVWRQLTLPGQGAP